MPTPIYDSRAFVKRLTEAGMPEGQADTLASENLLLIAEQLATKDDLKALEGALRAEMTEIRGEIANFRAEMKIEIATLRLDMGSLENRLLIKLGGLMAAMLTLFRLL